MRYILGCLLAAAAVACTQDPDTAVNNPDAAVIVPDDTDDSGDVTLHFAVQVPGLNGAATRTLGQIPDYKNLALWCVLFEGEGSPSSNFLVQVREAELDEETYPDRDDINRHFNITLRATEQPAVIHFIALNTKEWPNEVKIKPVQEADESDEDFAKRLEEFRERRRKFTQNPENIITYGPENVVIPELKTTGGEEAYWQRVAFDFALKNKNQEAINEWVSLMATT